MTAGQAAGNRWLVLVTTSLGAFIGALMFTSVNVALPSLVSTFDTRFSVIQWVVLAYLLTTATLLPIVGRLADMLGKKKLYLAGYLTFTVGTLLCGLAPDVTLLIVFRGIQGVGSAALTALGLAIVTDVFPERERGRAIGISASLLSTGIVAGPTLGGLLIDLLSWQWIFLLSVPLGVVGMGLALRFIPGYDRSREQRFDLAGAAVLFLALLAVLLGLTLGQELGFASPVIVGLLAGSVVLAAVFIAIEVRVPQPVVDLRLFRNPQLTVGLVTGFATFISISGTILLMPFYLENVLGFPPRQVGLLMSVVPIVLVVVAPLAGAAADRIGERPVTVAGLGLLLIGYASLMTLSPQTSALGYLLRFLPVGLGMGVFQTPNNSAIMGSVDRSRSGVAGGLLALTRSLGQTSGIAVLGTLWAARVLALSPRELGDDATAAAPALQVAGLHTMFLVIVIAIGLSLLLALWDWSRRRSPARSVVPAD